MLWVSDDTENQTSSLEPSSKPGWWPGLPSIVQLHWLRTSSQIMKSQLWSMQLDILTVESVISNI